MELIAPTAAIEPDSSFILMLPLLKRQTSVRALGRTGFMFNTVTEFALSALNTSANGTTQQNFRVQARVWRIHGAALPRLCTCYVNDCID